MTIKRIFFSGFENRFSISFRSGRFCAAKYHGSALRAVLFSFLIIFSSQLTPNILLSAGFKSIFLFFYLAGHLDDARNSHRTRRDLFL